MHFGTVKRSGFFVLLLFRYLRYIKKSKSINYVQFLLLSLAIKNNHLFEIYSNLNMKMATIGKRFRQFQPVQNLTVIFSLEIVCANFS